MLNVPQPSERAIDVITCCIDSKIRNINTATLLDNYQRIIPFISAAESDYRIKAEAEALYGMVNSQNGINGIVSSEEMANLYDKGLVTNRKPRVIYDKILLSTPQGICPFCAQNIATTLDHYLPKKQFPLFALTPINLLPSCKDCNTEKLTYKATNAEAQLIHPYFDDTNDKRWLYAEVQESSPLTIVFMVRPPDEWSLSKKARVKKHFDKLKLGRLYSSNAGTEVTSLGTMFKSLFNSAGKTVLRTLLADFASSNFTVHQNSWRGATYDALSNSEWFCEGGVLALNI